MIREGLYGNTIAISTEGDSIVMWSVWRGTQSNSTFTLYFRLWLYIKMWLYIYLFMWPWITTPVLVTGVYF